MIDAHHFRRDTAAAGGRMTRPTIHHVAQAAGVSFATVDRVVNNRGGVAEKSVLKVQQAIKDTGYVRDIAAANLSRRREYCFVFLVPDSATGFAGLLRQALGVEQTRLRAEKVQIEVIATPAFQTAPLVAALRARTGANTDGIALIAPEAPEVQAEIARLVAEGVCVITLVSDLPHSTRNAYVGPDNVAAGRTAAGFMGRFIRATRGSVLMVAGSLTARDHMERVMGFRMTMAERFAHLTLLPAVQGFDDAERVQRCVREALTSTPPDTPLVGVYAVGAGNRGLLRALEGACEPDSPRPVTIVHELTETTRSALQIGALDLVIDQNPAAEIHAAVTMMRDFSDRRPIDATRGAIPLNIFVRENV